MKMIITQRTAQDDYHAQLIAQGMENAGADIFTITNDAGGYIRVYCKHSKAISTDTIDREISAEVAANAMYYEAA
ncbi:MAG: hypothetical protein M0R70_08385 [Nitrospirae bacterium]|nr:hypothetical protein [Nitrospirota bacterium]